MRTLPFWTTPWILSAGTPSPAFDSSTQPCFPVPPTVRLMSWLRRGLMGMQSCHQCCLGTVAGLPEKLQRQVSTWGQEAHGEAREGLEPLRQPRGLHRTPYPCLGTIQSQPPRPMLPSSVP